MVEIKNVSLKYNEKQIVLKNTNIDIKKGECILLCGESGCGKTTVTKLINGLIPHFEEQAEFSGEVVIAGVNTTGAELYQISQYVGSVFQNPKSQFFHSDTESEIVFGMENAGINPELIRKRLDETVEKLHLENMLGKSVFLMSGGEKQLLAFASVYAMGADIFVLDEPTANLDMEVIEILANMIHKCKEEGKTVIIAEHRLYFLTELIDRAIYMKSGKIEKWFDSTEFKALTEKERISMGLRTLIKPDFEKIVSDKGTKEKVGLEINNLTCVYGKNKVFADLNLSAYYGEVVGILGHNGAGKSTLVRCLCGLLKEKEGTISLCGRKMKPKERQKRSFLVMQDVNHQLFSDSVKNECLLSAPNESDERIDEILNSLDLLEFKDKHPMALSGGQKQRLAIATAILSEREILIFDEPTSGLDYGRMNVVSSIIKKIASSNRIILIVSHDFEFLNNVCDRAILIDADRR